MHWGISYLRVDLQHVKQDMRDFRKQVAQQFADHRKEVAQQFVDFCTEVAQQFADVRHDIRHNLVVTNRIDRTIRDNYHRLHRRPLAGWLNPHRRMWWDSKGAW